MSSPAGDTDLGMTSAGTYRIVVRGPLHGFWIPDLARMIISERSGAGGCTESVLVGSLPGQVALVRVLLALHKLGVPLLSLELLHPD